MLRQIWRRVLDEVWMSRPARLVTLAVAAGSVGAATTGWAEISDAPAARIPICLVAAAMSLLAAAASVIAVTVRHFRWCWVAGAVSGLATVTGVGVIWWHQSAPPGQTQGPTAWMVIAALCAAWLTATWIRVITTPLERSQPDLRMAGPLVRGS
ncbi:hypothetical protein MSZK_34250 [Mycobacterium sp. shizuoka-1]|nr:hypothetical protein MSZK_34250 [Mycobacterium sp. shizuoka-1]